jgi:hypothetical protein
VCVCVCVYVCTVLITGLGGSTGSMRVLRIYVCSYISILLLITLSLASRIFWTQASQSLVSAFCDVLYMNVCVCVCVCVCVLVWDVCLCVCLCGMFASHSLKRLQRQKRPTTEAKVTYYTSNSLICVLWLSRSRALSLSLCLSPHTQTHSVAHSNSYLLTPTLSHSQTLSLSLALSHT